MSQCDTKYIKISQRMTELCAGQKTGKMDGQARQKLYVSLWRHKYTKIFYNKIFSKIQRKQICKLIKGNIAF